MQTNPFTDTQELYIVDLEVSLKDADYILGFINISHIPYTKLKELFKNQLGKERFLFDNSRAYQIDEDLYLKYKPFFNTEVPFTFNFNMFQYSVALSSVSRMDHKKDHHEELPPFFDQSF